MQREEAREILKGCGGCLLFSVIFFILASLWFAFGEKLLLYLFAIPVFLVYKCGPWIILGLLVLLVISFVVFMIKVILNACGIGE